MGEGHAAIRAFECKPAFGAEDKIGKPPSIQKEEALLLILEVPLKSRSHSL